MILVSDQKYFCLSLAVKNEILVINELNIWLNKWVFVEMWNVCVSNELTQFYFYLVGDDVSNLGGSFASRAFDADPCKAGKKRVFSQLNAVE